MLRIRPKLIVALTIILCLVPLIAFAQTGDMATFNKTVNETFKFFSLVLTAMQAALWPILLLMGGLLNNDLLFSGGMQTILLNIWSVIRDFVNILFVLGILFIAIYNIIGLAGDEFSIPKTLPMIAIALIAVNFSFLMCKVVLDVVNVTTTAIFAVPMASDSLEKYAYDQKAGETLDTQICERMMKMDAKKEGKAENPFCKQESKTTESTPATTGSKPAKTEPTPAKFVLTDFGKDFFSTFNSRNAAMVMAVELMGITDIDNVQINEVSDIKDLAINTIFSLIFFVIYATAFVALFVAMLMRVVVLWISIAVMPISFLGIAFKKAKDTLGKNDPLSMFFSHALMPLKVSLVLTIGMIMITQLKQISPGGMLSTNSSTLGAITTNMSSVQQIIAGLATAAFIWIAAFTAMEGTKSEGITNKIKGAVQGFGTSIAKLPLYAPIIPTKEGNVGIAALAPALSGGPAAELARKEDERYRSMMGSKEDKFTKDLEGAGKDKKKATGIIAERMMEAKTRPLTEKEQKAIGASLKANNIVLKGMPSGFQKNLEEGKIKENEMSLFDQVLKENKSVLVAPAVNKEESKTAVKTAVAAANTVAKQSGIAALATEAKDLEEKTTALDTITDEATLKNKKIEIDKLTQELTQKTAAAQPFITATERTQIQAALTPEGNSKDPAKVQILINAYDTLKSAGISTEDAKKALVTQIGKAGGAYATNADRIADSIVNKTVPPIPQSPAPAAPNPPPAPSP